MKEALPGEYQTLISVTVKTREEAGINPREDFQSSTITLTVTEGT